MSTPYPDWVLSNPVASMRRTAEWFVEKARTTFLTDGTHVELFFLFREDGSYSMGPPPPDMPKDQFVAVLRQRIRDDNNFGVVHILEAWVYVPRKPNDHTWIQLMSGEMRMSDLKHEDKTESLLVHYKCRDGTQRAWISPIVRPKAGGVALGNALEMDETGEGRFASLF